MTTIHLNETVSVKLTKAGIEHYRKVREIDNMVLAKYKAPLLSTEPQTDSNGLYSCELWRLFNEFGAVLAMDKPTPFEGNSITIKEFTR